MKKRRNKKKKTVVLPTYYICCPLLLDALSILALSFILCQLSSFLFYYYLCYLFIFRRLSYSTFFGVDYAVTRKRTLVNICATAWQFCKSLYYFISKFYVSLANFLFSLSLTFFYCHFFSVLSLFLFSYSFLYIWLLHRDRRSLQIAFSFCLNLFLSQTILKPFLL